MSSIDGVKIPAGLVLPPNAAPKWTCEICGGCFWDHGWFMRHVKRCVKKNRDSLEALAHAHRERDPLAHVDDQEAIDFQRRRYGDLSDR